MFRENRTQNISTNTTNEHDGEEVMIWACFAATGQQNLDALQSLGQLHSPMCMTSCLTAKAWLKQGHKGGQRSKSTTEWLKKRRINGPVKVQTST